MECCVLDRKAGDGTQEAGDTVTLFGQADSKFKEIRYVQTYTLYSASLM